MNEPKHTPGPLPLGTAPDEIRWYERGYRDGHLAGYSAGHASAPDLLSRVRELEEALRKIGGDWPTPEEIAEGGMGCGCGHEEIAHAVLARGEE